MILVTCISHVRPQSIVTPRSLNEVTGERFWSRREREGGGRGVLETEKVMVTVLVGLT